jgi:hypothetical protein
MIIRSYLIICNIYREFRGRRIGGGNSYVILTIGWTQDDVKAQFLAHKIDAIHIIATSLFPRNPYQIFHLKFYNNSSQHTMSSTMSSTYFNLPRRAISRIVGMLSIIILGLTASATGYSWTVGEAWSPPEYNRLMCENSIIKSAKARGGCSRIQSADVWEHNMCA